MNPTPIASTSTHQAPLFVPNSQAPHRFEDLGLIAPLSRALQLEGYEYPTPIQHQAIPHLLTGRDLLGCAQTGTGKTAAFALPILQLLATRAANPGERRVVKALVLAPTRELATQIADSFAAYGRFTQLRYAVIFGGVAQQRQVLAIRGGVDIIVATPGRLVDLISQRLVDLSRVEMLVLDEADRMLDMGFLPDMRRVLAAVPTARQTLLFSATMPSAIDQLARSLLKDPVRVSVAPVSTPAENVAQSVYFVDFSQKRALLQHLLADTAIARAIVFCRTKHGASRLSDQLDRGGVPSAAIHGNKSQNARERALASFKDGGIRVLVATDIAARGIDVDGITHVVNFDLPNEPETYVHRIGRTARAGATGVALSLCSAEERSYLSDIERLLRQKIGVVVEHPFPPGSAPGPSARTEMSAGGGRGARPAMGARGSASAGSPRRPGRSSWGGGRRSS